MRGCHPDCEARPTRPGSEQTGAGGRPEALRSDRGRRPAPRPRFTTSALAGASRERRSYAAAISHPPSDAAGASAKPVTSLMTSAAAGAFQRRAARTTASGASRSIGAVASAIAETAGPGGERSLQEFGTGATGPRPRQRSARRLASRIAGRAKLLERPPS